MSIIFKVNTLLFVFIQHKPLDFRRPIGCIVFKKCYFFYFSQTGKMLLEAKSLSGRCHGNGMAIAVSLWLCDFHVIRNLWRQLFLAF